GCLQRYVEATGTAALQELLRGCGGRGCLLDNLAAGAQRDAQVEELLELVRGLQGGDAGAHYTNALYARATELLERNDISFEEKCELLSRDV
ncbi:GIMA1 GTPase, partial [Penelope pileata]|nr:GIMA1 GTPase [Penelope pileata]